MSAPAEKAPPKYDADQITTEYDPDCPACLRGLRHTNAQHEEKLRRVLEASR
jgi:hypothetical protein